MKKATCLILPLLLWLACSQPEKHEPDQTFQTAVDHLAKLEFSTADSIFADLSHSDTSQTWGRLGTGLLHESRLEYIAALKEYWDILAEDESFAPAYGAVSRVLNRLDRPYRSLAASELFARTSGYRDRGNFELARACVAAHQFKRARSVLEDAVKAGYDPALADLVKAQSFVGELDIQSAQSAAGSAFGAASEQGNEFYREAAVYYEMSGKTDSAVALSRKALESSGGNVIALQDHFFLCLRTQHFEEARQILATLDGQDSDSTLIRNLTIRYHLAAKNTVQAFLALQRQQQPLHVRTIDGFFMEFKTKFPMGDYFTCKEDIDFTDRRLEQMEVSAEFMDFIQDELIIMLLTSMNRAPAYGRFDTLNTDAPRTDEYLLGRAFVATGHAKFDEAQEALDELIDRRDDDPAWLVRIADMMSYDVLFKYDQAEEIYYQALDVQPRFLPAFEGLIDMLMRTGQPDKALMAFGTFPHFAEVNPRIGVLQATCMALSGATEDATAVFERNLVPVSGSVYLVDDFLRALDARYDFERLEAMVDRWVELRPETPDILIIAAEWKSDLGKYSDAEELAKEAEDLEPGNTYAAVQRARALFGRGKKRDAYDRFEKLMKEQPYDSEVNLYYSQVLSLDKKQEQMAGNYARSATSSVRNSLRAMLNVADMYERFDRPDLAVGRARQAANFFKIYPRAHYYLGRTLFLTGKPEATEHLRRAIELGLGGDDLGEARRMLGR